MNTLRRFIFFTLAILFITSGSIIAADKAPKRYIFQNGDWNYKVYPETFNQRRWNVLFDAHSHTKHSDGKLTVEQNIQWHIANGFNACAISDHNTWDQVAEARKIVQEKYPGEIIIFPATEWTTDRIHMNIILPVDAVGYENIFPSSKMPGDDEIKAAIYKAHKLGGICIVNHHLRTLGRGSDVPGYKELKDWGVDYFEINRNQWDQNSVDFAQKNGLGIIAGTDMHTPGGINGWTGLHVEKVTPESIFAQLKSRNTRLIFQEKSSNYLGTHDFNPKYKIFRPVIELGTFLKGYKIGKYSFDWEGIGILVCYLYGFFLMSEVLQLGLVIINRNYNLKEMWANRYMKYEIFSRN